MKTRLLYPMDRSSFHTTLIEYGQDILRMFKIHQHSAGVFLFGRIPSAPPEDATAFPCAGVTYNPFPQRIEGFESPQIYPWCLWVFYEIDGKILKDVIFLEYHDDTKEEIRIFRERLKTILTIKRKYTKRQQPEPCSSISPEQSHESPSPTLPPPPSGLSSAGPTNLPSGESLSPPNLPLQSKRDTKVWPLHGKFKKKGHLFLFLSL